MIWMALCLALRVFESDQSSSSKTSGFGLTAQAALKITLPALFCNFVIWLLDVWISYPMQYRNNQKMAGLRN